jgi:pimeloyl-ACP methyl ester carboxylesterase
MAAEISVCSVNGYDIAYNLIGEGQTIVLVHGITTYSFIWRKIIPLLSGKYRVLSIDLLGCGNSAKPLDTDYSLPHHSALIHEMLGKLDIGRIHLVGHDVGGGIAQIFAVNYPERLYDLTLINSVGHDFWPVQPIIAMRTPIIRQLAMATLDMGSFRLIVRRGLHHKERLNDELMKLFWKPMSTKKGRRAFLHFANCLNNRDLIEIEDQLRHLTVKSLIIRGEADVYLSAAISEKLHHDIPHSSLIRIATGGHFIQEDEPEMIATEILDFFQRA